MRAADPSRRIRRSSPAERRLQSSFGQPTTAARAPFHRPSGASQQKALVWKRMWISWWTDPLRKVVYGSYDSAPAPILGRSESSVPSGKRLLFSIRRHAHPCRSGPCRRRRDRCRESLPPIRPHPMSLNSSASATSENASAGRSCTTKCAPSPHAREFNGWDHDQFAARGLTFSLFEMTRLSGWVRTVLARPLEPIEGAVGPLTRADLGPPRAAVSAVATVSPRPGHETSAGASPHQVVHIGPSRRPDVHKRRS